MLQVSRTVLLALLASALPAATVLIRDVTVIDVTGSGARPHLSVLVTGQKIVAVAPSIPVPKGVAVINGKGKFLIPGLWDMHVHLWETEPLFPLYIANGVTGVRDMGSDFTRTNQWRKNIAAGKLTGPKIITSGPAVMGPNLSAGKLAVLRVTAPQDGENVANQLDDQDVDFIKVLSDIPHDAYISLAHRARILRLPFAGHVPNSVSMEEAIDARQRSMEHLFGLLLACSSDELYLRRNRSEITAKRLYETYDARKAQALFQRFTRFDVWQVPTLTLRQRMDLIGLDQLAVDPHLKYIPAAIRKTWEDPRDDLKKASPDDLAAGVRDFAKCLELVAAMHHAAVPMMAGTDTGDPYVLPGFALHDELALLVRAGMTPLEAIQSATLNPARFLGLEATQGSVEKGKLADLVLLNANPLDDIQNTRQIEAVILRGRLLNRHDLDNLLVPVK
ncbi:MAG: amidohydrolase family protein [Bryobacteraceae bacterium]